MCFYLPIIDNRTECTLPMHSLYKTAVQCATIEDMVFMQGRHPRIRSMIIAVYSFTLLGNLVDTCDALDYKPFLSYVREDDDYPSLCKRLSEISGESDLDKYRLAVVSGDKVPHFIPKPTATAAAVGDQSHSIGGNNNNSQFHHQQQQDSSVWSLFCDKYPVFSTGKADYIGIQRQYVVTGKSKSGPSRLFPQLGIQRSVSDLHSKSRYQQLLATIIAFRYSLKSIM